MKKIIALFMAVLLMLTALTGCVGDKKNEEKENNNKKNALVIVLGKHANAKNYFNDKDLEDVVKKEILKTFHKTGEESNEEAEVSLVIADGNPEKDKDAPKLEAEGANPDFVASSKETAIKKFIKYLKDDKCKANDEEVDTLNAFVVAQNILEQYPTDEYNRNILAIDTYICTTGYLDMKRIQFTDEGIRDAVNNAKDGAPTSLEGTNIKMYGMGNVAGSQKWTKSEEYVGKFEKLWMDVLTQAGANESDIYINPASKSTSSSDKEYLHIEGSDESYPYVDTIIFPRENFCDIKSPNTDGPAINLVLHNAELGFESNSSKFRDEEQAKYIIESLVNQVKSVIANGNVIYVVGSIAKTQRVPSAKSDELSKERANAVVDILVSYGISRDKFIVIDAGTTEFSWRNAKECVDGRYLASQQEKNRLVALISSNSTELVQEINDNGYN